jgi:hypothetical protein
MLWDLGKKAALRAAVMTTIVGILGLSISSKWLIDWALRLQILHRRIRGFMTQTETWMPKAKQLDSHAFVTETKTTDYYPLFAEFRFSVIGQRQVVMFMTTPSHFTFLQDGAFRKLWNLSRQYFRAGVNVVCMPQLPNEECRKLIRFLPWFHVRKPIYKSGKQSYVPVYFVGYEPSFEHKPVFLEIFDSKLQEHQTSQIKTTDEDVKKAETDCVTESLLLKSRDELLANPTPSNRATHLNVALKWFAKYSDNPGVGLRTYFKEKEEMPLPKIPVGSCSEIFQYFNPKNRTDSSEQITALFDAFRGHCFFIEPSERTTDASEIESFNKRLKSLADALKSGYRAS